MNMFSLLKRSHLRHFELETIRPFLLVSSCGAPWLVLRLSEFFVCSQNPKCGFKNETIDEYNFSLGTVLYSGFVARWKVIALNQRVYRPPPKLLAIEPRPKDDTAPNNS